MVVFVCEYFGLKKQYCFFSKEVFDKGMVILSLYYMYFGLNSIFIKIKEN